MLVHAALPVRSLASVQLLTLLWAIPVFWLSCFQLHASSLLDHSTLECFHNVFAAPLRTAQDLRILLQNGSRKRCSTRSSTDRGLDFCTSLLMLDCRTVKVCSFRNCIACVCCHSSHLETRFASRTMRGMSGSLLSDPLVRCHFSFRDSSCSHADQSSGFAVLVSHFPIRA